MRDHLERYLKSCRARDVGVRTIENYRTNISLFRKWWEESRPGSDVSTLRAEDIEDYMFHLMDMPFSPTTRNNKLRDLRAFVKYLQNREIIAANVKVILMKIPETEIIPLSDEQLAEVYDACLVQRTLDRYRDFALMRLLEETGIRLGECLRLTVADVNLKSDSIKLRLTKNKKVRSAYLTPAMKRDLVTYLEARRHFLIAHGVISEWLWVVVRGKGIGDPLQKRTIEDRMTKYGERAGIPIRVSPHTFRHTFARSFIVGGGNMLVLKELLGHSTLEMVLRYVKLFDTDRQDAYLKVMAKRAQDQRRNNLKKFRIT